MERNSTKLKKQAFLKAYKQCGNNASLTCKNIKISRAQFYRWKLTDLNFNKAIEDLDLYQVAFAEQWLNRLLSKGDRWAIAFVLNNKGRHLGYGKANSIQF